MLGWIEILGWIMGVGLNYDWVYFSGLDYVRLDRNEQSNLSTKQFLLCVIDR